LLSPDISFINSKLDKHLLWLEERNGPIPQVNVLTFISLIEVKEDYERTPEPI
jgi:hypothetical protein